MDNPNNPPIAWKLVAPLAGFKFLIHLATIGAWGSEWFVDELYFMACAEHLSWGYVDLPPDLYDRYTEALGFDQPRIENHDLGPLPQLFADRYGWREIAEEVARIYRGHGFGDGLGP